MWPDQFIKGNEGYTSDQAIQVRESMDSSRVAEIHHVIMQLDSTFLRLGAHSLKKEMTPESAETLIV